VAHNPATENGSDKIKEEKDEQTASPRSKRCPGFALAPIFERPKSKKFPERVEKLMEMFGTQDQKITNKKPS